jgi:hypothetical protein
MSSKSMQKTSHSVKMRSIKKVLTAKINDLAERTKQIVMEKFTDEQLTDFRDLFNMFDRDNQGKHVRMYSFCLFKEK